MRLYLPIVLKGLTLVLTLVLHTNIASIGKYCDDLNLVLLSVSVNIKYKKWGNVYLILLTWTAIIHFVFDATETSHVFHLLFIIFQKWDDLKFHSPGNYESTFIELILPKRKKYDSRLYIATPYASSSL